MTWPHEKWPKLSIICHCSHIRILVHLWHTSELWKTQKNKQE